MVVLFLRVLIRNLKYRTLKVLLVWSWGLGNVYLNKEAVQREGLLRMTKFL